jgi:hypothetical protein
MIAWDNPDFDLKTSTIPPGLQAAGWRMAGALPLLFPWS